MTEPIVMIDHIVFGSAHDAAVYCASQRNEHLALARSFRDDVWWFKAHDHEEYAMQIQEQDASDVRRSKLHHRSSEPSG